MHLQLLILVFLSFFIQNIFQSPVYFEGTISCQSDTLDYSGRKVVFKPGTRLIFNDSINDELPINFVIIADTIEIQGELDIEGIGEPGKPGGNGKDCSSCRKTGDNILYVKDWEEFQNKCKSNLQSDDFGEPRQKGGKGGTGATIYFYYSHSYTGLSNINIKLFGGKGGKPGKGGLNRTIKFFDANNPNEVKQCKGGNAGNLGYGETGASGNFNLRKADK